MRIGSLSSPQTGLAALLTASLTMLISPLATFGQSRYASDERGGAPMNQETVQALYMAPSQNSMAVPSPYLDADGNPMIVPAGYCEQCVGDGGPYGQCDGSGNCGGCSQCGPGRGGFMGPFPMGAGGTDPPIGYDLMNDAGIQGNCVDQRGPHYFDVRAEAVFLSRDETFGRSIVFTKENVGGTVRLTSDQLDYGVTPGFRVIGRYDIGPLAVLELGYTGVFDFNSSAKFQDPNGNLFSLFSNFGSVADFDNGTLPVTSPGGPGPQTERAFEHSISMESDLQSAEMSYRRYWLGWSPRISGTLLAGFRYTKLDEEFEFRSIGETIPPTHPVQLTLPINGLTYTVDADNNLAGFQSGGDVWVSLMQGLRIGAEGKAGLYNNHYLVRTNIVSTVTTNGIAIPGAEGPPNAIDLFRKDQPAFIAEASADVVADILPSLSLRAGYEVMFLNSIVLAGDNFNTGSPYNPGPGTNGLGMPRNPFVADQSHALYTGVHAGIEYIW